MDNVINKLNLIGMTEEKAYNILKSKNIDFRIIQRDNEIFMNINNNRLSRLNLIIVNNLITEVGFG